MCSAKSVKYIVNFAAVHTFGQEGKNGGKWNFVGRQVCASHGNCVDPDIDCVQAASQVGLFELVGLGPAEGHVAQSFLGDCV